MLFLEARSNTQFADRPVPLDAIRDAYELVRWGPTANNAIPLRIAVAQSVTARAAVISHAKPANQPKLERAPLILVVAHDERFHDHLPVTSPGSEPVRDRLEAEVEDRIRRAHEGTLLQTGYLIVGLRAAGLAVRPYGGFDKAGIDGDVLAGTSWRSEVLLGVGFPEAGDHGAGPRKGRLSWEHAARVL